MINLCTETTTSCIYLKDMHSNHNKFFFQLIGGLVLIILLIGCEPAVPWPAFITTSPDSPSPTIPVEITPTATLSPTLEIPVATEVTDQLGIEPTELRGQTVRFWHIWPGKTGEALRQVVNSFNQTNEWGIHVEAIYQDSLDDLEKHLLAALGTDREPDVVMGYVHQAAKWDTIHPLVDLEPYVNNPIWGLTAQEQSDFYPVFWNQDLVAGKRLGIPAQRTASVLYYNKSWARVLGYGAPPGTPQEFKEQACAAAKANRLDKDKSNDQPSGYLLPADYTAMLSWIYAYGGQVTASEGEGYQFNTEPVIQAFTFLRDLYDQGCARQPEPGEVTARFAHRQGLFVSGSLAGIPYQARSLNLAGNFDQWMVLPYPSGQQKPAITVYGPSFVVLSSTPQRQLAAWLLLKWIESPENQAKLIQASGFYPLRATVLDHLESPMSEQWKQAVDALQDGQAEPALASWSTARWAVNDAVTQLYRYYFTMDQVPSLALLLDQTTNETVHGIPTVAVPTATPTVTSTPTRAVPSARPSATPRPSATATVQNTATLRPPAQATTP